jgi:DNA replication protein DnaC
MSASEAQPGDPHCDLCHGAGYVVEKGAVFAQAHVCTCVPSCRRCDGRGVRLVEVDGIGRLGRCRCQVLPDRVALFNQSGIPNRHHASSLESFRTDWNPRAWPAFEHVRRWSEAWRSEIDGRGLVLMGEVGRGKTHLMVAILRYLMMQKGVEVRFVEFSHLLSELKAGFDAGHGEATVLEPLVRVPVLAIDELGKGRGSDWERAIVDALVSHRYNAMATILATTNFSPTRATGQVEINLAIPGQQPSLGDRVGDRVFSRLKEMCTFVPVDGEDCRVGLEGRQGGDRTSRSPRKPSGKRGAAPSAESVPPPTQDDEPRE